MLNTQRLASEGEKEAVTVTACRPVGVNSFMEPGMSWIWKKGLPVRSHGGRQPLPKTGQEIEGKKKYDPYLFLSTASCQPEEKRQGGPGNIPTGMDFGERSRAENRSA